MVYDLQLYMLPTTHPSNEHCVVNLGLFLRFRRWGATSPRGGEGRLRFRSEVYVQGNDLVQKNVPKSTKNVCWELIQLHGVINKYTGLQVSKCVDMNFGMIRMTTL